MQQTRNPLAPLNKSFRKLFHPFFVVAILFLSGLPAAMAQQFGTIASGNQGLCTPADPALITFSIPPSGAPSFTFQWYSKIGIAPSPVGNSTTGWTLIPNATSMSYNPPAGLSQSTTYACMVTSSFGTKVWAVGARQIVVYTKGEISSTKYYYYFSGNAPAASFQILPSGLSGATFTYQWFSRNGIFDAPTGSSTTNWLAIPGATGTSYDPPLLTSSRSYACRVTASVADICTPVTSWAKGVFQVHVFPFKPGKLSGPQDICANTNPAPITFSELPGPGTSTYQWYYMEGLVACDADAGVSNIDPVNPNMVLIPGATSTFYDPPSVLTASRSYLCRVTNSGISLWAASPACLRVLPSPTKAVISSQQFGCGGFSTAPIPFTTLPVGSSTYSMTMYYVPNTTVACPTTANFNPTQWTLGNQHINVPFGSVGPNAPSFSLNAGTTGVTYILKVDPSSSPSCETSYVTNCHRALVLGCRENVDQIPAHPAEEDMGLAVSLGDAYPNPASGAFEIPFQLSRENTSGMVKIHAMDGKTVFSRQVSGSGPQTVKLEDRDLKPGFYVYTLEGAGFPRQIKKMVRR